MDLAAILESMGEGILAVDAGGAVAYTNAAARRILGELAPDALPTARALAGEEIVADGFPARRLDGGDAWLRVHARAIRGPGGETTGAVLLFRDVTASFIEARRAARAAVLTELVRAVGAAANAAPDLPTALRDTIALVRGVLGWPVGHALEIEEETGEIVSTGVWLVDDEAAVRPLREASQRQKPEGAPHTRAVTTGTPLWLIGLQSPEFVRHAAFRATGLHTGLAVPVMAGGRTVGVLEFYTPARVPRDDQVLAAVAQVGVQVGRCFERRRAEAHEAFVQAVVDHVADPIFVKDRSFRFVFLSRALCEMVGYTRDQMIGKTDYDFFPKDQADFFRVKDAEMFNRESRVVIDEEPITDARGELHWLATTKVPLRGPGGEVTHLVGVIHDITRLKRAEEELSRKNTELARQVTDTTAALVALDVAHRELETFSYTVSHDLRAPLRAVLGYSALLVADSADRLGPEARQHLARIEANARRMAQLIDDLLALSRVTRASQETRRVDLSDLCTGFLEELARSHPERQVEWHVEPGLEVNGDPNLLRVAFENLLRNAWKFTVGRDPARIEVGRTGEEIFVRDNGAGFDMEYVDRLFRPFSRLHGMEEFPGSGIGLATVERIARRHHGSVRAEGAVGVGATFYVRLP